MLRSVNPAPEWQDEFALYATVSGNLVDPGIEFDVYQPRLAHELTSLIEKSVNYRYRAEPPLCGSCQKEVE